MSDLGQKFATPSPITDAIEDDFPPPMPQIRHRKPRSSRQEDTVLKEDHGVLEGSHQLGSRYRASTGCIPALPPKDPRCLRRSSSLTCRTDQLLQGRSIWWITPLLLSLSLMALQYAQSANLSSRKLRAELSVLTSQHKFLHETMEAVKGVILSQDSKAVEDDDKRRSDLEHIISSFKAGLAGESSQSKGKGGEDALHRKAALVASVTFLLAPFLGIYFMDSICDFFRCLWSNRCRLHPERLIVSKWLAYELDVLFSRHARLKPLTLLGATVLLIGLGGLALFAVSSHGLGDAIWLSWTYVADAGNHADSQGFGQRVVSVLISCGGMLVFALMLGLVSDAISEWVDSLRKGKSDVIESGHILILGWSDKLSSLLKQLSIANQSSGGGVVVILAERDKEAMEIDIARMIANTLGTVVICRSGSPLNMADLQKVSVSTARSIIVLAQDGNADQSDARALRVILSLTAVKEGLKGHVVVEISDLDNEPLVRLVGGDLVETLVAHDVIGRLMIQCARQPGLAQIWEDFLGFENAEFYLKRHPELDGMRFGDALISFADAIPCGVKIAAEGGRILLNPPDDYVFHAGDSLLVVAEDDDTYSLGPTPQINPSPLPSLEVPPRQPEKILLVGWRRDIDDMIMVLDLFLASGSEIWMLNEVPIAERNIRLIEGGLDPDKDLVNIKLVHKRGNAVIRRHLETLPLESFNSILILADEQLEDTIMDADSRSLATLLLIRDIQSKRMKLRWTKSFHYTSPLSAHMTGMQSKWMREMQHASTQSIVISEILDSTTKNLVAVTGISDYVLSNELVSMALAMVAEDKEINSVLKELFSAQGNELYLRPAELYLSDGEELTFAEVMVRARQRKEIVLGCRYEHAERSIINPGNKYSPRRWSINDVLIVLALEE